MKKRLAIVRINSDGHISPVSIAYGQAFFGADTIAVFEKANDVKHYLKKILPRRGKGNSFKVINLNKEHNLPIIVGREGTISCKGEGVVKRGDIESLNGYPIKEWIQKLKNEKKLGIA